MTFLLVYAVSMHQIVLKLFMIGNKLHSAQKIIISIKWTFEWTKT